ncbi:TolC family protein [Bacteroidales bacterium OttesenSCG-928-A17]|nr:TolC family protein [Bacteroidales bacterium OttesenSCG-928-A17]
MERTLLLFALWLIFPSVSIAQEVYSLQKILETGLENNYDIRIVRNEQKISENNATLANAGFLPKVDLSAGYSGTVNDIDQKYADDSEVNNSGIHNHGANLGLNLNWTLFDGLSMQTNYERLKEFRRMGELNTQLAVEDLIAGLTAEYYNYVRQNIQLGNLNYAVKLSKERLRIVEAHYTIGSKSGLELQQARVDFNADSSKLITQREAVYASRISLNRLMALDDVSRELAAADTSISPDPFLNKEKLWELTLENNTNLLLSDRSKTVSELDYKSVRSRDFPYLKVNAGYGYALNNYGSPTANMIRQNTLGFNYGVTLGFTVFDGNRKRERKNARLTIQNKELQHEYLELSLKADLANIWMAYQNNLGLLNLEKENLAVAHDNYSIAMERYRLGDLPGIDLREAQNSLLEAEERILQAAYNTKLCEISLLQLSGQLQVYLQ